MKLKSTYPNMVIVLTLICIISGLVLAVTYGQTKDTIAQIQQEQKMELMAQVLPPFDNNPEEDKIVLDSGIIYPGYQGDQLVGFAVQAVSPQGYGGNIEILAGFSPEGDILGVKVLKHTETPGLGSKLTNSEFLNQFTGKNPETYRLAVKKDGGDVDSLTAATVSSRAFSDALSRGWDALSKEVF